MSRVTRIVQPMWRIFHEGAFLKKITRALQKNLNLD